MESRSNSSRVVNTSNPPVFALPPWATGTSIRTSKGAESGPARVAPDSPEDPKDPKELE